MARGATPKGWIGRPVLPIEDIDNGLYLTSVRVHTVTENAVAAPWERREAPEPTTRYYVSADDFMVVQKERDEFKRAAALINAEMFGGRDWSVVAQRLAQVGLTADDGKAMLDLVEWARAGGAR